MPVVGAPLTCILLAAGLVLEDRSLTRAGLVGLVAIALATLPAYFTGEPAEEVVHDLPDVSHPVIEEHERFALLALLGIELSGLVALAGLITSLRHAPSARLLARSSFVVGLAACFLLGWTAHLGGQVRHSEIRSLETGPAIHADEDDP